MGYENIKLKMKIILFVTGGLRFNGLESIEILISRDKIMKVLDEFLQLIHNIHYLAIKRKMDDLEVYLRTVIKIVFGTYRSTLVSFLYKDEQNLVQQIEKEENLLESNVLYETITNKVRNLISDNSNCTTVIKYIKMLLMDEEPTNNINYMKLLIGYQVKWGLENGIVFSNKKELFGDR